MSGEDDGLVGQLSQKSEALDDLHHAAAFEVGAPDGLTEKGVATEQNVLVGDMETHRATGVAGGVDDMEGMAAKGNLVSVAQVVASSRVGVAETVSGELDSLIGEMIQ